MPLTSTTATGIAHDYVPGPPDAPILLFLHAGVAHRRMWDEQFEALAHRFGLVRLDLRGFGDSHDEAQHWSHAADVVGVLDALDILRVHVVASSFGSGVAVQVALAHP